MNTTLTAFFDPDRPNNRIPTKPVLRRTRRLEDATDDPASSSIPQAATFTTSGSAIGHTPTNRIARRRSSSRPIRRDRESSSSIHRETPNNSKPSASGASHAAAPALSPQDAFTAGVLPALRRRAKSYARLRAMCADDRDEFLQEVSAHAWEDYLIARLSGIHVRASRLWRTALNRWRQGRSFAAATGRLYVASAT